ncbi:MAG: LytTR family transcriptional regulator DNA-binding domain-containing protein [Chitinophagales bacterium]|nr:LytTR family transcriptional regulator DNA-binding domain-containing protein [Chitinophagales bacterium]MCZ2393719.1 LytTR family transcriptional regulator DNA-binding domain-containing protein [Chitinophagales bacterium]
MNIFEIAYLKASGLHPKKSTRFFYQMELKDNHLKITYIDDSVKDILGYTPEEFGQMKANNSSIIFNSKDNGSILDSYRNLPLPTQFSFETILVHKNGYPIFVKTSGTAYKDEKEDKINYIGYTESVTAIVFGENKGHTNNILNVAYNYGQVGTFYFDIAKNSLHWSDETKKIHGYEGLPEPSLEELGKMINSKDKFSPNELISKVLNSKNGYQTIYSIYRKNDQSTRYLLAILYPITDSNKKLISISGNVIDLLDDAKNINIGSSQTHLDRTYDINDSIFIKQNQQYISVPVKDIIAISSMRDYIQIYTKDKLTPYIHYATLYKFKEKLPIDIFVQIHRSHIINVQYIEKLSTNIVTVGKLNFPISRNYKTNIKQKINK